MIRLDATTRKLQAVLAGAVTTNQLPCTVSYSDKTSTDYVGATQLTNTNSTTAVDICAAPGASTVRDIDYLSIRNRDTAAATVTVMLDDNGTDYEIVKAALAVGDQLIYTHGDGWRVVDADGNLKTSATGGGISDGDKGDITVSSGTWTIDAAAVTLAKMANLAQDQFIGRTTASTGVPETATITAAARNVLDDTTVGAMATTLGLGTSDSPQFAGINLGHASDTTLTRASAGVVAVEGVNVVLAGAVTTDGITMSSDRLLGRTTAATGAIEEITVGSGLSLSGGSLTASGSASITLGTPQATTSGTSIDFTSIPSGTKMIVVMLTGVSTNGTSEITIRIGDSGGIEATGYSASTGYIDSTSATYTTNTVGFRISYSVSASNTYSGMLILCLQDSSGFTWNAEGSFNVTATTAHKTIPSGYKSLSSELDRVRLTTEGGANTFDAGQINILYFG